MYLYVARNTVNGKAYVGLTTINVPSRWKVHKHAAKKGSTSVFHAAIRKYGPEAFAVEEVACLLPGMTLADLCELEKELIAQEGTIVPNGYNMSAGGEGALGEVISQTKRAKFADVEASAETREKIKKGWTPERKEKHRKMLVERNKSEEGRRRSDAYKKRMKDVLNTPEQKARIAAAQAQRIAKYKATRAAKGHLHLVKELKHG